MSDYSAEDYRNMATGWLHGSIERHLPGFLAREAEVARPENPEIAAVLQGWADDQTDFGDRMRFRFASIVGR